MEVKWTPGPWSFELMFETDETDPAEIRSQMLVTGHDNMYVAETMVNNAHLIAAAPDLYEALDKAVAWMALAAVAIPTGQAVKVVEVERLCSDLETARAVLAKARGEP